MLDLPPLENFQRLIVATILGDDPVALVLIPKGNGKTSLCAAIALWHLLSVPRAAVLGRWRPYPAAWAYSCRYVCKAARIQVGKPWERAILAVVGFSSCW